MVKHPKVSKSEAPVVSATVHGSKKRSSTSKWLLVAAFVVVFGGLGSVFLYASHADSLTTPEASYWNEYCPSTTKQCVEYQMGIEKTTAGKYYAWAELQPGTAKGSVTVARTQVDSLTFGVPTVAPLATVSTANSGSDTKSVIASTPAGTVSSPSQLQSRLSLSVRYSDNSLEQYVTGLLVYGQFKAGVTAPTPTAGAGTAFNYVPPTATPAPKPVAKPSPAPTPVKPVTTSNGSSSSGSSSSAKSSGGASSSIPAAYTGYEDGCGKNAGHYYINTTTKVSRHVDKSYAAINTYNKCVCTVNAKVIAYNKYYPDSQINPGCSASSTTGSSSGSSASNNSGANTPGSAGTSCNAVSQRTSISNGYICHGNVTCTTAGYVVTRVKAADVGLGYYCAKPVAAPKNGTPPAVNASTSNNRNQKGRQVI